MRIQIITKKKINFFCTVVFSCYEYNKKCMYICIKICTLKKHTQFKCYCFKNYIIVLSASKIL